MQLRKRWLEITAAVIMVLSIALTGVVQAQQKAAEAPKTPAQIALPAPNHGAPGSLEDALTKRRSVREFSSKPLTQQQIGQLFWAAQGITHDQIKRAAPSAGAVYPLEIYVVTAQGFFHYIPQGHAMVRLSDRDLHQAVFDASKQQDMLQAPAIFVITGDKARMMKKYPAKAELYMSIEAGHVAENVLLEATSMGLVSVPAGGFVAADLQKGLSLPADEWAIYLIPVGYGK